MAEKKKSGGTKRRRRSSTQIARDTIATMSPKQLSELARVLVSSEFESARYFNDALGEEIVEEDGRRAARRQSDVGKPEETDADVGLPPFPQR